MNRTRWLLAAMIALAASACGGPQGAPPRLSHDEAVRWVREARPAPGTEAVIARLLANQTVPPERLEAAVAAVRPALDALDALDATEAFVLTPDAPRAPRDAWEALAWLAYGDARLLLASGDAQAAYDRALLVQRLGHALGGAEGAGVMDVVTGFTLREAGALQTMRLAALAPPSAREERRLRDALASLPDPEAGWAGALRAEGAAVRDRVVALAADPVRGLGLGAERLPPDLRGGRAEALLDQEATEEAVTRFFLDAAAHEVSDCAAPWPDLPPPDLTTNPAGAVFAHQTERALRTLMDRRCLTIATERASGLALRFHAEGLPEDLPPFAGERPDPFSGAPFAYDAAAGTLVSAGVDRTLTDGPGAGPFDPEAPTYDLTARPLLSE